MAAEEIALRVTAKDEASKVLKGIDKQVEDLLKRKVELEVDADSDAAKKELAAIEKKVTALQKEKAEIEVTAKVDRAIGALDEVADEAKKAEAAADALSRALGPELAAKADLDRIIGEFQRMGLSLDEITANADRLGGKLREVGESSTGGLESAFRRAKAGSDDLGKSADSSKSVLANMVGNATQDLGALGGIAGSAGVAIGQMGEYMVDAAGSGDKLSTVLRNFAVVAGPIAAIALAVQVVTGLMGEQAAKTAAAEARTKAFGEAMENAADDTVGLAGAMREASDEMADFFVEASGFGGLVEQGLLAVGQQLPLIGSLFDQEGVNIAKIANRIGLSIYEIAAAAEGVGAPAWDAYRQSVDDALASGKLTEDEAEALAAFLNEQAVGIDKARDARQLANVDQKEANALLQEMLKKTKPLQHFTDQWNILYADLSDGTVDTKEAADAVNYLSEQLGMAPSEVISLAMDHVTDRAAAMQEGLDGAIDAIQEWRDDTLEASADVAGALDDITADWQNMADAVSEQSFADALDQFDALSQLDLAQVRQDTVKSFDGVKDAIGAASKEVKNWGKMDLTPDSFEELRGMPDEFADITDAVSTMRGSIQTELKQAFDTGGIQGFTDKFDFFAGQVREQFTTMFRGMGLPEDQVQQQVNAILADLGLLPESKEIIIKLTRDQESKNALDLFMSDIEKIEDAQPSVDIRAKVAAGDIQGALDELNAIRLQQGKEPIVLPTDIETLGLPEATRRATASATTYAKQHPTLLASEVLNPSNTTSVVTDTQGDINDGPVLTIPAKIKINGITALGGGKFRLPNGIIVSDAGGIIPPGNLGLVAERRPEIINDRFLATQPTLVPPGTRVTSGARTARILRTRGIRGLRAYDAGGVVASGQRTVNINVNTAVIGNRYDLMRVMRRAAHDSERLMGTRG